MAETVTGILESLVILSFLLIFAGFFWYGYKFGPQGKGHAEVKENIFRIDKDWNVTLFDVYETGQPVPVPVKCDVDVTVSRKSRKKQNASKVKPRTKKSSSGVPAKASRSDGTLLRECVSFVKSMGVNVTEAKIQTASFLKARPHIKTAEVFIDEFLRELNK